MENKAAEGRYVKKFPMERMVAKLKKRKMEKFSSRKLKRLLKSARIRYFVEMRRSQVIKERPTRVLWNFENCPVRPDQAGEVLKKIKALLRANGFIGPVMVTMVAAHRSRVPKKVQDLIAASGISLKFACTDEQQWDATPEQEKPQIAGKEIKAMVRHYIKTPLPLANIMIVSGDSDFARIYYTLGLHKYHAIMVYMEGSTKKKLLQIPPMAWEWSRDLGIQIGGDLGKLRRKRAQQSRQPSEKGFAVEAEADALEEEAAEEEEDQHVQEKRLEGLGKRKFVNDGAESSRQKKMRRG